MVQALGGLALPNGINALLGGFQHFGGGALVVGHHAVQGVGGPAIWRSVERSFTMAT